MFYRFGNGATCLLGFFVIFAFFLWEIYRVGPLPRKDMEKGEKKRLYLAYIYAFVAVAAPVFILAAKN